MKNVLSCYATVYVTDRFHNLSDVVTFEARVQTHWQLAGFAEEGSRDSVIPGLL